MRALWLESSEFLMGKTCFLQKNVILMGPVFGPAVMFLGVGEKKR